jgi:hypothetical protein
LNDQAADAFGASCRELSTFLGDFNDDDLPVTRTWLPDKLLANGYIAMYLDLLGFEDFDGYLERSTPFLLYREWLHLD